MSDTKYGHYLVQKPGPYPLELQGTGPASGTDPVPGIKATHLMTADETVQEGFFSVDCTWLWSGNASGPCGAPHTHEFSHVIGIIGGHREDAHDLGGEITVWLDGRKETFTRSALIFVPAGVVHGPFLFSRITRPVFFITVAMTGAFTRTPAAQVTPVDEKKYAVIDHTKEQFTVAADGSKQPYKRPPHFNHVSTRILHIEEDMVPGAFYIDFVWIWSGTGGAPAPVHDHEWPELIAMAGVDPEHPRHLGGEMSIELGGEYHPTTKSTLVCIPPHLDHCPWEFHDIRKPTLVFSAGPQGTYTGSHKEKTK